MNLVQLTSQQINLVLTDAAAAVVDLTGATEVRAKLIGPVTIGPIVCTVVNAVAGTVRLPLLASDKAVPGNYMAEIEARWGNTRITGFISISISHSQHQVLSVVAGDTPTFILSVPGVDLAAATSVAFLWGATPAAASTAIAGTSLTPPAGGTSEQIAVTLAAVDTAVPGIKYGRLLVDGNYTTAIQINIQTQALI